MVFFTETWKPASFYDRIRENASMGLHTLLLLDIKVREQSLENMARGRKVYEPPRYMTVSQCALQMLETEEEQQEKVYSEDSLAIGCARVGADDQRFACGTLRELCDTDVGPPLHSLVLLGKRAHELEKAYIKRFAVDQDTFEHSWNKYHGRNSYGPAS